VPPPYPPAPTAPLNEIHLLASPTSGLRVASLGQRARIRSVIVVARGPFVAEERNNPPALKPIERDQAGQEIVRLGPGVVLRLGHLDSVLDRLLGARVVTDESFTGLGSIRGGCRVFCTSNACRASAVRIGRLRVAATVAGVEADVPRYVLLTPPKLNKAAGPRHESRANRAEAGLNSAVFVEELGIACGRCERRGALAAE
jgi:hypothetical protein